MLKAGFKTQTALAQKIAENENLDLENPPHDMVNRVFREVSVDPHTLERIANAYTLMLSSDEVNDQQKEIAGNSRSDTSTFPKLIIYGAVALLMVMTFTLLSVNLYSGHSETSPKSKPLTTKPVKIAIIGANTDNLPEFQHYVTRFLGAEFIIQSSDISPIASSVQPREMAEKLNVDYILEIKFFNEGRYQAIIISLLNGNQKQVVYTNAWTRITLAMNTVNIARDSSQFIRYFLGPGKDNLKTNSSVLQFERVAPVRPAPATYRTSRSIPNKSGYATSFSFVHKQNEYCSLPSMASQHKHIHVQNTLSGLSLPTGYKAIHGQKKTG